MLTPMAASTSCVSMSQAVTSQLVCRLRTTNARLTTPFLVSGATIAQTWWGRVVQPSPVVAVSLLQYRAPHRIASSTLNGAQCISPITLRRRISRFGCMRIVPTSSLTSSLAPSSPAATSYMFRVCRERTTPLRRTSAMPGRQPQARVPTPARVAEHQHRHLQQQPQLRLQQRLQQQLRLRLRLHLPLPLQPRLQLQLQLQLHPGRRLRQGLVGLRHRGHSGIRNNFVGEADSFPYR